MKEKFGIEHILCYYWLLSLLKLVKPESLNKCLMKWAKATRFQQLIAGLDLQGCMIVADALNYQKETAEAVIKSMGDYLLDAEGNQPTLHQEIRDYVQDERLRKTMDCKSITVKSRDRIEMRTAYTTADINWFYGKGKWKNLCCIGAIKIEFERKGTKTERVALLYLQPESYRSGVATSYPDGVGRGSDALGSGCPEAAQKSV